VIVLGVAVAWLVVAGLLCAAMRHATRAPWWETLLLDFEGLDVTTEVARDRAPHGHTI
jgi:hypothetical protein